LNRGALSLIFATASLASGFSLPVIGKLLDRVSTRTFTIYSIVTMTAACVLLGWAESVWTVWLGFFLLRVMGPGAFSLSASTTASRHFNGERGRALSLSSMGHTMSEAFMPLILTSVLHHFGWRDAAFFLASAVLFIYGPAALYLLRKQGPITTQSPQVVATLKAAGPSWRAGQILRDARFFLMLAPTLVAPFLCTGLFYHQSSVQLSKHWHPSVLPVAFTAYAISRAICTLALGPLITGARARKIFGLQVIPMILGLVFLAAADASWSAAAYLACFGVTIGLGGIVQNVHWAETYGTENLGAINGVIATFAVLATASGPLVIGTFFDVGMTLSWVCSLCAVGALCAVALGIIGTRIPHPLMISVSSEKKDETAPPPEAKAG
jgi:MFS family permease